MLLPVPASYSSLYIKWGTKLLTQNIGFSNIQFPENSLLWRYALNSGLKLPRSTLKQSPPTDTLPFFSRVKNGRGRIFVKAPNMILNRQTISGMPDLLLHFWQKTHPYIPTYLPQFLPSFIPSHTEICPSRNVLILRIEK